VHKSGRSKAGMLVAGRSVDLRRCSVYGAVIADGGAITLLVVDVDDERKNRMHIS